MDARRFLFDTCFDPVVLPEATHAEAAEGVGDGVAVEPAPPPPPVFSEEELMEARARGYAEGEAAGRGAAEAEAEAQLAAALSTLGERIGEVLDRQAASDAELRHEAATFAVAMVRRLQPELARRHGLGEVEAVIRDCMSGLLAEPRLIVRMPADQADALAPRIVQMAEEMGFEGRLDLKPDGQLAPGDCRLQWSEGGAERIAATVLETVDAAMARLFDVDDHPPALPPAAADRADPSACDPPRPSPDEAPS